MKADRKDTFAGRFLAPPAGWRSAPFWAWNAKLDPARIAELVPEFAKMGYGGFFMHSRPGLDTPYLSDEWFAAVRAAVEAAKKAGLSAWMYDEDRWPSGTGGGFLAKERPEHAAWEIRMCAAAAPQPPESRVLAWYAVVPDAGGTAAAAKTGAKVA
ncbi:MAG: hypothetical protein IJ783_10280, partial [Kiritimatiellae bacterium]|nr:hypothetical protein [Kiritimatiellia bacterium]